jgi:hypothetical protein
VAGRRWNGVRWPRPVGGRCPLHGTRVGELTQLCPTCHRKQLDAARARSREWEDSTSRARFGEPEIKGRVEAEIAGLRRSGLTDGDTEALDLTKRAVEQRWPRPQAEPAESISRPGAEA